MHELARDDILFVAGMVGVAGHNPLKREGGRRYAGDRMILLRDIDRDSIIKEVTDVLQVGYGKVEITIKDFKILDIIPSPRKRVKEEPQGTTQGGSSYVRKI